MKHVLLALVVAAGCGALVMWLWNWLIPAIAGWETVNFWQALGILALARILFGGFGRHGMTDQMDHMHSHYHSHLHRKWQKMTPEEREAFIRKRRQSLFRGRDFCGERDGAPEQRDE